eukprot:COSAG02_NODE_7183_length_3134_cov_4.238221_2_plen_172_part_00
MMIMVLSLYSNRIAMEPGHCSLIDAFGACMHMLQRAVRILSRAPRLRRTDGRTMLPGADVDTQLKEVRSKSAHEWATARFFAATNAAAATDGIGVSGQAIRAMRWRLAAKISIVVALLIWLAAAVLAAELLPRFALPFLVVAIGIWVGGMHFAGHRFGSSANVSPTREEHV